MAYVDIVPVADTDIQIGLLLAVLEDVTREWTEELGDIPDAFLLWQAFPGGHSIGALILHIVDVEAFWLHQVAAGLARSEEELRTLLSEETDQYALQWPTPPAKPLSWYLEQHRNIRERTRQYVLAIGNPEHTGKHQDYEFTLRWLLNHVISHEAYHGGQAVLLALMQQKHAANQS
jgi:uncharacterized damage-inducible protein DinB